MLTILVWTWYTGQFGTTANTPLFGPAIVLGLHGPALGGGFGGGSINAPAGTSWTVVPLTNAGTLTVTDNEVAGDRFQMFDNGIPMRAAPSPFTAPGQNPGQVSPGDGLTSLPCIACDRNAGEDINNALGNAHFSSATFLLNPGANVITGTFLGSIGHGDFNFVAESRAVPGPTIGAGLPGLIFASGGFVVWWRNKRRAQAAA
jgi:hypothetical protein